MESRGNERADTRLVRDLVVDPAAHRMTARAVVRTAAGFERVGDVDDGSAARAAFRDLATHLLLWTSTCR